MSWQAVMVASSFPLPESSGGRKRAARLLTAMQNAGAEPTVLTADRPAPEAAEEAARRGWRWESLPPAQPGLWGRLEQHARSEVSTSSTALVARLRALASRTAFVQCEEIGALQYALRVPAGVPTVASLHNVDSDARSRPSERTALSRTALRRRYHLARMARLERSAVRSSDLTVAVSRADRDHFAGLGAGSVALIPNGIDDELLALEPVDEGSRSVLFFGQLSYPPNREGIVGFVRDGWPRVSRALPGAQLRIAGSQPPPELIELARRRERVVVLGYVPSLLDELGAARLVLAPIPYGGGTRMKVLEALAAARPVVGTTVGVEQIGFEHERHGLVADGDDQLADAAIALLDDHRRAVRLGLQGRELAARYRWGELTKPLEERYRAWLERRR